MARWLPTSLLLFVAALAPVSPAARGAVPPRLDLEAPRSLEGASAALRWLPPDRWQPVLDLVGLVDGGRPIRVLLVPEEEPLARRTPRWVTGFAVPEQDAVVLLPERVISYPDDSLANLLTHEVTHVLLTRAAGDHALPRWFQEGVAMVASREASLADQQRLLVGGLSGVPPSTDALDRAFAGEGYAVDTAYAVSGALAEELVRAHGRAAVGRIAAAVARGLTFPQAFVDATGSSLPDFDAGFWRRFRLRYRWLPFLTSGATLWFAITALALVAIARRRQRDAALRRRWDDEERATLATAASGDEERYGPN